MEQVAKARPAAVAWIGEVPEFIRSVRSEMAKVTWPTREELVKATRMILLLSFALGCAIGLMDKLFSLILVDGVARLAR
jgi:preprotein translocase subunit SecE